MWLTKWLVSHMKIKYKYKLIIPIGLIKENKDPIVLTPQFKGLIERKFRMAAFQITDSQKVTLGPITAQDKKGNPVPLDPASVITWAIDNPALLSIVPSTDNLSAVCSAVGPLGAGTVSVKVADSLGNPIAAGSDDCTVVAGAPATINIPAGVPEEQ